MEIRIPVHVSPSEHITLQERHSNVHNVGRSQNVLVMLCVSRVSTIWFILFYPTVPQQYNQNLKNQRKVSDSTYQEKQYFACHMISYLSLTAIFFQKFKFEFKTNPQRSYYYGISRDRGKREPFYSHSDSFSTSLAVDV